MQALHVRGLGYGGVQQNSLFPLPPFPPPSSSSVLFVPAESSALLVCDVMWRRRWWWWWAPLLFPPGSGPRGPVLPMGLFGRYHVPLGISEVHSYPSAGETKRSRFDNYTIDCLSFKCNRGRHASCYSGGRTTSGRQFVGRLWNRYGKAQSPPPPQPRRV